MNALTCVGQQESLYELVLELVLLGALVVGVALVDYYHSFLREDSLLFKNFSLVNDLKCAYLCGTTRVSL